MNPIRVAIIDDHEVVRNGLKSMLASYPQLMIVYTTGSATALLEQLQTTLVHVLLMDIQMPEMNGIDLCKLALRQQGNLKIVAFSSFDDTRYVKQVLRSGAKGYLLKNADKETIVQAVEKVAYGEEYIDAAIQKILLQESLTGQRRSIFEIPLTKREKEIVELIAAGKSNQEIADALFISLRTVETHRLNVYQKLDVKNTAGLIKEAVKRGLVG
jgi:DNA-binding NarL/FixJ family response regulator